MLSFKKSVALGVALLFSTSTYACRQCEFERGEFLAKSPPKVKEFYRQLSSVLDKLRQDGKIEDSQRTVLIEKLEPAIEDSMENVEEKAKSNNVTLEDNGFRLSPGIFAYIGTTPQTFNILKKRFAMFFTEMATESESSIAHSGHVRSSAVNTDNVNSTQTKDAFSAIMKDRIQNLIDCEFEREFQYVKPGDFNPPHLVHS